MKVSEFRNEKLAIYVKLSYIGYYDSKRGESMHLVEYAKAFKQHEDQYLQLLEPGRLTENEIALIKSSRFENLDNALIEKMAEAYADAQLQLIQNDEKFKILKQRVLIMLESKTDEDDLNTALFTMYESLMNDEDTNIALYQSYKAMLPAYQDEIKGDEANH